MLGKRVSGNQFFKIFWGRAPRPLVRGLRAFGAPGRSAPPAAAPRTSTQSCREGMPVPPQSISPHTPMLLHIICSNFCCFKEGAQNAGVENAGMEKSGAMTDGEPSV